MKWVTLLTLFFGLTLHAETAEEAWASLLAEKSKGRATYAFVENDSSLPNVFIYGDSISIAYTPTVRESLKGAANVYRLHVNGGDSSSVIQKVYALNETMGDYWDFEWDIIHFNIGLHDLKYVVAGAKLDKVTGEQVSSVSEYESNLRDVIAYFKALAPEATLIFATTTPVPEGEPGRHAGDAARYNQVALKVLKDHPDIIVNDLYAFTKPNQPDWWTKPGNVHFTEKGFSAQGRRVAEVIEQALEKR